MTRVMHYVNISPRKNNPPHRVKCKPRGAKEKTMTELKEQEVRAVASAEAAAKVDKVEFTARVFWGARYDRRIEKDVPVIMIDCPNFFDPSEENIVLGFNVKHGVTHGRFNYGVKKVMAENSDEHFIPGWVFLEEFETLDRKTRQKKNEQTLRFRLKNNFPNGIKQDELWVEVKSTMDKGNLLDLAKERLNVITTKNT